MEEPRPVLYGVSDYAQIRKKNAWFVDRTAKIRDLEKVAYALFLRPRRFGKSLLCSILEAYYDIRFADRFDELFGGTAIGDGFFKQFFTELKAATSDPEPTPAAIKAEAAEQLDRYCADPALVAKWRLKPVESPTANLSTFQPTEPEVPSPSTPSSSSSAVAIASSAKRSIYSFTSVNDAQLEFVSLTNTSNEHD